MNALTAQILMEAFAINADVAGMQAENDQRKVLGQSMAYTEEAFAKAAAQLRGEANRLHEHRMNGFAE